MAGGANAVKLANIFRTKLTLYQSFAEVFKPSIRKERLIELIREKAEVAKRSEIATKVKVAKEYWKLEMAPPRMDEMQKLQADLALFKDFMKTGCYKFLTVKQAWLFFLVGMEMGLWFFLGETIGKMHIVGYKV